MNYPRTPFDAPMAVLFGSYWADAHHAPEQVEAFDLFTQIRSQQAAEDIDRLAKLKSRLDAPLLAKRLWMPLRLGRNSRALAAVRTYGGGSTYGDGGVYGKAVDFVWDLPEGVKEVPSLVCGLFKQTSVFIHGVDFVVDDGLVRFSYDPFEVAAHTTDADDDWIELWAPVAYVDDGALYTAHGYPLLWRGGTASLNAIWDGVVQGPGRAAVCRLLGACLGAPTASSDETVLDNAVVDGTLYVVTDKNTYASVSDATPAAVGDVLRAGDPVTDALRIIETNNGPPSADDLPFLGLSPEQTHCGLRHSVAFLNAETPLVVTTKDDRTYVSWAGFGDEADLERFFDATHVRGVAAGRTLSQCLDTRPDPQDEPVAGNLPATINPVELLLGGPLRGMVFFIARPALCGEPDGPRRRAAEGVPPFVATNILMEITAGASAPAPTSSATAGFLASASVVVPPPAPSTTLNTGLENCGHGG